MVSYRDFKHFPDGLFSLDLNLLSTFHDMNNISFDILNDNIMKLVDKFAPIKYKYLRENHEAFVTVESHHEKVPAEKYL